ncbi:EamA family transporter [Rhizobium deserti]|uniref:EamA family transporter n=1 Tax=Rhizobium deserti TaxID=2547961 RepID=A0A4R5UKY7_9HYPH|nr:EamA family transporter [Rhizobium deserti]TDK37578.1 EamA family transporter [Rhizobium deserti]
MFHRDLSSFLALCLIWGTTWIGITIGIERVPAVMFAGTRFTAAGILLIVILSCRDGLQLPDRQSGVRLAIVSVLSITLCYGPMFWGMNHVSSGTAAVLEMSMTPVALLCFAIGLREEAWSAARFAAVAIGVVGLSILFLPDTVSAGEEGTSWLPILGAAAVTWAAISSAFGSILARPLMAAQSSAYIAAWTNLIGGLVLVLGSLIFEEGAAASLTEIWEWEAFAAWAYLVVFGSLIGYTIYMRLIRDVGSRAGSFAFVSPVIAVTIGVVFNSETVTILDICGMILMLGAAYFSMRGSDGVTLEGPAPQSATKISSET